MFETLRIGDLALRDHLVTGELFTGTWDDIGTLERLETLRQSL